MEPLLTVGHGTDSQEALLARLVTAGVTSLVDVRRLPASRTSAHLHADRMAEWLPAGGVGYRWEERLGGRRRLPRGEPVRDTWWQVRSFQAYAAHTRTADFVAALHEVLAEVRTEAARVAVMCSELVWWRCHRRLIADVAVLAHDCRVEHLMLDGALRPHALAAGAVLGACGQVVWPEPSG